MGELWSRAHGNGGLEMIQNAPRKTIYPSKDRQYMEQEFAENIALSVSACLQEREVHFMESCQYMRCILTLCGLKNSKPIIQLEA